MKVRWRVGARDQVELEALLAQIAGVADGEAGAVERAVLIAADVHPVEGDVRGQRPVEPGRARAELVIVDRLLAEQAAGRDQIAGGSKVDSAGEPPPEL